MISGEVLFPPEEESGTGEVDAALETDRASDDQTSLAVSVRQHYCLSL